ncbi:MAG TPA: TadE/TadG family type IV pilus assembly protein [Phenylobacterium sp.]
MRNLITFWRDTRGAAIVEMAFIAPIIGGLAAVSFAAWDAAGRQQDMQAALDVGAQYYMNGGSTDETAVTAATAAWQNKPANGVVQSSRVCKCGITTTLCTNLCSGKPPSIYVHLNATGSDSQAMFSPVQSAERVVRVR